MAIHRRLLSYAKKGLSAPSTLSELEIKKVCYALQVHYNAMGIE